MKFNCNSNVRVRLTDDGLRIHRDHFDRTIARTASNGRTAYQAPKVDGDGWSSFQLWELMQVFGPVMCMGRDPPFNMDIDIPIKMECEPI